MAAPRVHHINTLTMCPRGAKFVNGTGGFFEPGRMVCHCLVIESDDGLVLVDTGISTADIANINRLGLFKLIGPKCDPSETAIARVRALGFDPKDVRHIVATHLDVDHAGGLSDFPDATVHIYRPEHEAAMNPETWRERERYHKVHFAHNPKWLIHDLAGDSWLGLQAVRPIERHGDIALVPLLGHSRGHCGVAVRTSKGWLLHAGDAYFHHSEVRENAGVCPAGLRAFQRIMAANNALRLESAATVKRINLENPDVSVTSAHCGVEFDSYASA